MQRERHHAFTRGAQTACHEAVDAAYSCVGASYFADEWFEYKDVTGSMRLQVGEMLSPFAGIGITLSARRYDSSTFPGNIIYSLGFSKPLD